MISDDEGLGGGRGGTPSGAYFPEDGDSEDDDEYDSEEEAQEDNSGGAARRAASPRVAAGAPGAKPRAPRGCGRQGPRRGRGRGRQKAGGRGAGSTVSRHACNTPLLSSCLAPFAAPLAVTSQPSPIRLLQAGQKRRASRGEYEEDLDLEEQFVSDVGAGLAACGCWAGRVWVLGWPRVGAARRDLQLLARPPLSALRLPAAHLCPCTALHCTQDEDDYFRLGAGDEEFKDFSHLQLKPDHHNRCGAAAGAAWGMCPAPCSPGPSNHRPPPPLRRAGRCGPALTPASSWRPSRPCTSRWVLEGGALELAVVALGALRALRALREFAFVLRSLALHAATPGWASQPPPPPPAPQAYDFLIAIASPCRAQSELRCAGGARSRCAAARRRRLQRVPANRRLPSCILLSPGGCTSTS